MLELIKPTDTLAEGYPKINAAIQKADQAFVVADNAVDTANNALAFANQSLANSQSVQEQLNQVVINGDSSVEAAQARVNADNTVTYNTLKERLDTEYQEISSKLADIVQVNVKTFGAVGDGITDDTNAFKDCVDYINGLGSKVKLFIPKGTYKLTDGIHLFNEITIEGDENSWIDYQGTGIMLKLGKDGITVDDFQSYKRFEVKNLGFKGGLNMSHGIYINKFVTQPRILNCNFENFGNEDGWGIYFDDDCWDGLVQGCRWDAVADNQARNFIGMYGRGNSRIRVFDTLATNLSGLGVCLYLNGFNNQVMRNKIEGFAVNVRLGGLASYSIISNNYFEKPGFATGCIEIGSIAGDNGENNTPVGIIIERNFCNTHLTNDEQRSYFIKPTKETDLIKDVTVSNNYVNSWNENGIKSELVYQNDLPGQTGNKAYDNYTLNISSLHTAGTNIGRWGGNQGEQPEYKAMIDAPRYYDYYMGLNENNQTNFRILTYDKNVLFQLTAHDTNDVYFYSNGIFAGKIDPSGVLSLTKAPKIPQISITEQKASANVPNGTLFEDTDGKLKYKNLAGTVTDLTI